MSLKHINGKSVVDRMQSGIKSVVVDLGVRVVDDVFSFSTIRSSSSSRNLDSAGDNGRFSRSHVRNFSISAGSAGKQALEAFCPESRA